MGWLNESAPGHEGWTIGLQRDVERGLARDLTFRALAPPADHKPGAHIDAIQAGCDCGWRSERIEVRRGEVSWQPFSPAVPGPLEAKLLAAWRVHVDDVALRRLEGSTELQEMVKRARAFGAFDAGLAAGKLLLSVIDKGTLMRSEIELLVPLVRGFAKADLDLVFDDSPLGRRKEWMRHRRELRELHARAKRLPLTSIESSVANSSASAASAGSAVSR